MRRNIEDSKDELSNTNVLRNLLFLPITASKIFHRIASLKKINKLRINWFQIFLCSEKDVFHYENVSSINWSSLLITLILSSSNLFLKFTVFVLNEFLLIFLTGVLFFFHLVYLRFQILVLFFSFFLLLNSQEFFLRFFKINFILMNFTSSLHFLSMICLLLSLNFFLVLVK